MKNNQIELDFEEKLLNNSLLFSSILKHKTTEHKIEKIKQYLDQGADINATDANYKNNTPLHVAVIKEEPEVVSFLLERGAFTNIQNSDGQTALDIARLSDKSTNERGTIVKAFEAFINNNLNQSCSQQEFDTNLTKTSDPKYLQPVACDIENETQCTDVKTTSNTAVQNEKSKKNKSNQQQRNKKLKATEENETFCYQKRTGTSGLSGQLYETKLLSLILFRALYVYETKTFLIATNVDSMGAFDDIVFRFCPNKGIQPRMIFVQAKHRDNPAKDKFTVEEIMKLNGDFSLHKYLESYIKIIQMFMPENNDDMFRGEFKKIDCEFIIYTSAHEKFTKKKFVEETEVHLFMRTNQDKDKLDDHNQKKKRISKCVFQFDYDDRDVELLVQTVAKSRAVLLAKRLSKFIFKDNHSNMMVDDLIKTYHVFLARHILEVEMKEDGSQNNFRIAKFRDSFFSSNDSLLLTFKSTICKEVLLIKKIISPENQDQVENILMKLTFKVPLNFGNLNFSFGGSEQKKGKKLEYLCTKFKEIFAKANVTDNIVMKVDDTMVGPNEMLQSTDLESYRLGGLVGNLLVFDDVTKILKFNFDVETLSDDNVKLLEKLRIDVFKGIDLSLCRFDINVNRFPRLSLIHDEYDKKLIQDFLGKLFFYTNQATEDKVEMILKDEIDTYFVSSIPRQRDVLFRVKGDAIFLKVHDHVQKWWKLPSKAPYLTESCKYFSEAEQDVLNSPLLRILNFNYTETIKKKLPALKFGDTALELLHLDGFFAGPKKILTIITEENALSSTKLMQYFDEHNIIDFTFIDMDYVGIGSYFVDVKVEVQHSKIAILVIVCKSHDFISEIHLLIKHFAGKLIVIFDRDLSNQIKVLVMNDIVERVDSNIGFIDLAETMRNMLLEDRYIVFQGKEVPLSILFEDESYHLINSKLLYMIINNEKITIGNILKNPVYDEISDVYINEHICRYITFNPRVKLNDQYNVVKYKQLNDDFTPDTRDIVLIADKREQFDEFVNMYPNCNVHWFKLSKYKVRPMGYSVTSNKLVNSKYINRLVWKKTRGNFLNLLDHIDRGTHHAYQLQPMTLKDVRVKVVIISAEPGMGKSSLLTHLAINTKDMCPGLWISKINLLEYTDELRRVKENKVDLKEAVYFLFQVIGFKAFKENPADFQTTTDLVSVIGDDIILNKNKLELSITGSNLFEIELFIHCYNNNRVVLLLDGFDEICPDFANEVIQLLNIFKKSKVVHLWVTSRLYNVLHQLENALETISFTIQPWSSRNQLQFLEKVLLRKLGSKYGLDRLPIKKGEYHNCVEKFYYQLQRVTEKEFLSIPLHLYIITELYQDSCFDYSFDPEVVNLNEMYERLVDSKFFKIRFGEKKPLMSMHDPDVRKLVDTERTTFLYAHKVIGAHLIFGKTERIRLFDDRDINTIRVFIENVQVGEEKTGIVQRIIGDKPIFLHYTFAEYFAAEFICDKLKTFHCRSHLWLYLMSTFLQSNYYGPQHFYAKTLRFFNDKLANHQIMFSEMYITDLNGTFEALLLERFHLVKALYTAVENKFENIVIILLKFVKVILNMENLNNFIGIVTVKHRSMSSCIVCMAVKKSANHVLTFLIKLIKDIDNTRVIDIFNCTDFPNSNPLAYLWANSSS